jgi:hypothetical protein
LVPFLWAIYELEIVFSCLSYVTLKKDNTCDEHVCEGCGKKQSWPALALSQQLLWDGGKPLSLRIAGL